MKTQQREHRNTALCTYTHLAFLINMAMDRRPETYLPFEEIHEAAHMGEFIALLTKRCEGLADFSLLFAHPEILAEMEPALRDAAAALEGRERRKAGVESSGLCLAQAIVLEAIQQQFHKFPEFPPEEESVEAGEESSANT